MIHLLGYKEQVVLGRLRELDNEALKEHMYPKLLFHNGEFTNAMGFMIYNMFLMGGKVKVDIPNTFPLNLQFKIIRMKLLQSIAHASTNK